MAKGKKQVKDVNPSYMTTREAAAFLGLSAGTLCVWRCQGKGPSYYKVGNAVRYKSGRCRRETGVQSTPSWRSCTPDGCQARKHRPVQSTKHRPVQSTPALTEHR